MDYLTVPPMFSGRTVAVLASGPSMSWAMADAVRHLPRIVVNSTFRLATDADIIYAADEAWWRLNANAIACPGLKVMVEILPGRPQPVPEGIHVMRNTGRRGFDPNPSSLRTFANSGAQAIQVAVHAGAARILLLGFDMHGGHWHDEHPWPLMQAEPAAHARRIVAFRDLAMALSARGISVINCTPGSRLDCFPRESLESTLAIADLGVAA